MAKAIPKFKLILKLNFDIAIEKITFVPNYSGLKKTRNGKSV